MNHPLFRSLDHLAIAVPNTEEALRHWRDRVGLQVLYSEVVNQGTVRLTHLDLGNTHLQLVEPLTPDHPIRVWLNQNGPGLHHLCFRVDNAQAAFEQLPQKQIPTGPGLHEGTQGKRAFFLDNSVVPGVRVEVTGP